MIFIPVGRDGRPGLISQPRLEATLLLYIKVCIVLYILIIEYHTIIDITPPYSIKFFFENAFILARSVFYE